MSNGQRSGFIALIGAPNAGKSTLLNRMVGSKVAIVTPKVQTTRTRIIGLAVVDQSQLIFVDTPGIFAPRRRLDRAMVQAAWGGARDADLVVVLIDAAAGLDTDSRRILDGLSKIDLPCLLALNKVDKTRKDALLGLADAAAGLAKFDDIFMISALDGDGVEDLKQQLAKRLPEGPWLYPADQLTDISERLLAAEMTREKVFLMLHQELPYASTVETENWKRLKDGSIRIEQVVYVQRGSQKAIVLGKGGRTIKAIGAQSRADLEQMFGCRVHLFLFVKVRDRWGDDPARYREMGLDFPTE